MNQYKTLRLILGDQLNAAHSWYKQKDDSVLYLVAELHQETNYVKHHIQKITAFFAAMTEFANALEQAGHKVIHLKIDDTAAYNDLPELIAQLIEIHQMTVFEYQRPDEYRLAKQLEQLTFANAKIHCVDTEHFLLPFDEISEYFQAKKGIRLENFYRKMRKRFSILMDGNQPLGGKWNFDQENRKKLKKNDLPELPQPLEFEYRFDDILSRLEKHKINFFGNTDRTLIWPTSRRQSLELLEHFCQVGLPNFGKFQDAMTANSDYAWSLYHSRLSFSMNTKMLSPLMVIHRAIQEFEQRTEEISLAQIEGFIRQILGWREFVRGMYWVNMPGYSDLNFLEANTSLPAYFWHGQTKMRCMQYSLGQSLDYAYAHHIQRLMVIGNFCLLAGIDPEQVDQWYLGVYIDAIEWVEMPNTRGMSQFADGGLIASKPYTASGAYINRMSDYCSGCHYSVKEKTSERACPFNSLYWHFHDRHSDKFATNPRLSMVYRHWQKMENQTKQKIRERAEVILENLEEL